MSTYLGNGEAGRICEVILYKHGGVTCRLMQGTDVQERHYAGVADARAHRAAPLGLEYFEDALTRLSNTQP